MRPLILTIVMLLAARLLYAQTGGSNCPLNMDFEMGDFTNWQCLTGYTEAGEFDGVWMNRMVVNPTPPTVNEQAIIAKSNALDKWGGFTIASPNGSNYTIKIGNDLSGGQASEVTYNFTVPTSGDDFSVTYACAIAFRLGDHWDIQQPRFLVKVYNLDDKAYINCAETDYVCSDSLPDFKKSTVATDVIYRPWFNTTLNFSAYKGKKLRLEFTAAGCTLGGHFGYAYIDINKICANPIVGIDYCNTATNITLSGPTGYAGYKWYNADRSKVLGTSSTLVFPTAPADGTVVNVDLTPNPGAGCAATTAAVLHNHGPWLTVTNPAPVCYQEKVDISSKQVVTATGTGIVLSYWKDAQATVPLTDNPAAVGTSGTYYIKATNDLSCAVIKPVTVTINPLPDLRITDPQPVCVGYSLNLTAATVTAGSAPGLTLSYWTDADATQPLNNPSAVTSAGTYYIKGINAMGCPVIKPVKASFYALPDFSVTDPTPVCYPDKVNLATAVHNNTGDNITLSYWQDAPATNPLSNSEVGVTGTYYIKAVNTTGCVTIKAVNVVVNALPVLVINQPADVCHAGKVNLSAPAVTAGTTGNQTFTYWRDAAATLPLTNYTAVADSGLYYIKATNASGCSTIKSVNVVIRPLPDLRITDPQPVCVGNSLNLQAAAITAGSAQGLTFSYWTDADATKPLNNPTAVTTTNTYYIQGTNAMGCTVVKPVKASFYALPDFSVTDPTPVCYPDKVNLATAVHNNTGDNITLSYWQDAPATNPLSNSEVGVTGTYYIKAVNTTGCVTIKAVNVVVNALPVLVINQPADVCHAGKVNLSAPAVTAGTTGNPTFTYWRDAAATLPLTNYTAVADSGLYYIKATNASGCSTVKSVNVVIRPLPDLRITDPQPVCVGNSLNLTAATVTAGSAPGLTLSYWTDADATQPLNNPSAVTSAGTYYIKGINAMGCPVIKPVKASFYALPDFSVTDPTPVCYPDKVNLATAVHNNTGDNITLSYWQDAPATNPLSNSEVGVTGTYYIKAVNTTGCVTIKAVNVVVNALPVLVINQPADVCHAGKVDLSAPAVTAGTTGNPTFTYWRDAAATLPLTNYTAVADSGLYYIKATNASGCSTVKSVNVVIRPLPDLRISDPQPVCVGNSLNLTAATVTAGSAPGLTLSYWTDAAATQPLNNPTAVTTTNTYYIQGTNAMGCTVVKPVKATFYEQPDFVVNDPAPVCYPGKVNLTTAVHSNMGDNVSISYWSDAIGTSQLTNTDVSTSGTYYVKATNAAGCFTIKAINVVINALPELVINQPADICMPGRVDLSASSVTAGSTAKLTFTYWRDEAATMPLTNYRAVADSGRYYIKATNTSGCYTVGAVLVNIHRLPVIYTLPLKALYQPRTVDLTQALDMTRSTSNATYTYWANSSLTVPVKNPKAVGLTGTYYIKAANAYGCFVVANVDVFLAPVPDILVPTAFTPLQVTNSKLYPFLKGVKVFKFFKLYNRWGNMVYETNDASADKGWDGQFKGAIAFLDTFTWVSEGVDYLGNIVHRSGNTVLLK